MNIGEINTHQIVRMRENIKSLREQKGWSVKHLSKNIRHQRKNHKKYRKRQELWHTQPY